jgi:hypothetical protein
MIAKLPENYQQPPDRHLCEIAVGETVWVGFTALHVNKAGECYLDPETPLRQKGWATIRVERREDGYHVGFLNEQRWRLGDRSTRGDYPVASVTDVGEDWDGE